MTALRVTYTVTVPDDATEEECRKVRDAYEFTLLKTQRRFEAVTYGLKRRVGDHFETAELTIEIDH